MRWSNTGNNSPSFKKIMVLGAVFMLRDGIDQYPVFFSETTLYDVLKDDVVWTATIRTIDPDNIDEAI